MKYTSRNPNGVNQVASSSVAITVLNTDVAVFTTGSLELDGALTASSATISGNVIVEGTASINTLVVNQTQYTSGSNQFGDGIEDTQTLFGTVRIPTGSFNVTGSSIMSGSLNVTGGITGSLFGTASYIPNLNEVTTAGNTTTNAITADKLTTSTGATKGIVIGGTSLFESANETNYTQLAISPSSGNKNAVFLFSPKGTANQSVMEFYHNSSLTIDKRVIFKNNNGLLQLGGDAANIPIEFIGNNSPWMKIFATGNVAIGTTADSGARLTVKGTGTTSSTTALRIENANASASLVVNDAGNVLIGTATDAGFKLDVNGTTRLQGNLSLLGTLTMGVGSFSYATSPNEQFTITGNQGIILNQANGNNGLITLGSNTSANFTVSISNVSRNGVVISRPVTPLTGTSNFVFNSLGIANVINYTNAITSVARGLFINPTLTAVSDFRAIETTTGSIIFGGNTSVTITGSLTVVTGSSIELQVTNTGVKIGNNISDIHPITGSINITGSISSPSFTGTDSRVVVADPSGSLQTTSQVIIDAYIDPNGTVAGLLNNISNWSIYGEYTGTPLTDTFQGQRHYNIDYFFEAINDNDWIRLIRG
jgi:hypothetical protein